MTGTKLKFIITAGGTGGHILPGLSVYQELQKDGHHCNYICRREDLLLIDELQTIKKNLIFFQATGLQRKFTLRNLIFLFYLTVNFIKAVFILNRMQPDAVIGMGGYITFPVLLASRFVRIPYFLCEQNSIPGAVNRFFSPKARKIFLNYAYSRKYLSTSNYQVVGNPLRHSMREIVDRQKARKFFNIMNKRKVLLIMGGSQGALKINNAVADILPGLKNLNILWLAGKKNFNRISRYRSDTVKVIPFLKEMNMAYSLADLCISRAGAMSITELSYFAVPALFIPLRIAAENHQYLNAKVLTESRASLLIEEKDLYPEVLLDKLKELIRNRTQFKKNIRKFYNPDSEKKIKDGIYKELGVMI